MYGTPPGIPGLVQTNITNSAEEKWALLDKDIEMEDSETENENRNGRTILHHTISPIMVRAISVYSAGVPYAARFTEAKTTTTLGYVSVLEFVSIQSYLKAISSNYGSNKEY